MGEKDHRSCSVSLKPGEARIAEASSSMGVEELGGLPVSRMVSGWPRARQEPQCGRPSEQHTPSSVPTSRSGRQLHCSKDLRGESDSWAPPARR